MDNKLTIGQMAKLNDISAQALRMYGKMGLIEPAYVNEESGYRYYDIRQSACLDMIGYMKSLGIPLKEIKAQLEEQNIDVITSVLSGRIEEINGQIRELQITQNAISRLIAGLEDYQTVPAQGKIIEEEIPERRIHTYYGMCDFHAEGPGAFEFLMRGMRQTILSKELPLCYFCNVSSSTSPEHLQQGEIVSDKMFIWADDYSAGILPVETLPAGRYLCIYFESFKHELSYAQELLAEIERRGLEIAGDYICEAIAEFPVFRKAERNTFLKIQVPVREKEPQPGGQGHSK